MHFSFTNRMLFAHMFPCISRRKAFAKNQQSKKASKKCSSSDPAPRKLRRKITKPISTIINRLRLKNKAKAGSPVDLASTSDNTAPSSLTTFSGSNHSLPRAISLSSIDSEGSSTHVSCCASEVSQHTIIYVSPADPKQTTDTAVSIARSSKVELSPKVSKRSIKITRASALRRECTSLPSLEPYRHRHSLKPSHLRRASCLSSNRCTSASVLSLSTKANDARCKSPILEFQLPLSSSTSLLDTERYTITNRPPSRYGIAYEIVFNAPSVRSCYTPEPVLGPYHTYSFPCATAKEEINTDEDGDAPESEEEAEEDQEESERKFNVAQPVPKCKYGAFFTAAKPPLPPSALERIRKYRHYQL